MVSYGVDSPNEPLTPLALACVRHCPCTRFVFIFLAIFCISCRILPYRCGLYVFLFRGFCCTVGALRPRYNPHHLEKHQTGLLLQVTQTRHCMCWRRKGWKIWCPQGKLDFFLRSSWCTLKKDISMSLQRSKPNKYTACISNKRETRPNDAKISSLLFKNLVKIKSSVPVYIAWIKQNQPWLMSPLLL